MEICKKHNRSLKNRKDKKGKFCPECVRVPSGRNCNPPFDAMNLKPKNKNKNSRKGLKKNSSGLAAKSKRRKK